MTVELAGVCASPTGTAVHILDILVEIGPFGPCFPLPARPPTKRTSAAAIEEQGAATQEISRNVRQAASGTLEVSGRIDGTNKAISTATGSAGQVLQAAETLSDQSRALTERLGRLVDQVRAA